MGRILIAGALVFSVNTGLNASEIAQAAKAGEAQFQRCVACHLADGAGVPGAFPKLKGRLANIVQQTGGRDYLTMLVSSGLTGPLNVAGYRYMGVMPAQGYTLNDTQLAALLNRAIVATADGAELSEIVPFSAAEVEKIKAKYKAPSMQHSLSLRPKSLE